MVPQAARISIFVQQLDKLGECAIVEVSGSKAGAICSLVKQRQLEEKQRLDRD